MLLWVTTIALFLAGDQKPREVGEGPTPAMTPVSWEMQFDYLNPPRRIDAAGGSYFYLIYKVTNKSPVTQRFYPTIQLVTEDLRVIDTDMGISNAVFQSIRGRHQATHPHLVEPSAVIGEIGSGADYAKESVAIWREDEVTVNNFTIFVAGLSGEARLIRNPAYDPKQPEKQTIQSANGQSREVSVNPKNFTVRKTLELRYAVPGSTSQRDIRDPELVLTRWIMR